MNVNKTDDGCSINIGNCSVTIVKDKIIAKVKDNKVEINIDSVKVNDYFKFSNGKVTNPYGRELI